ncbi:MAG: hypothetical protein R3E11_10840 [Sphingobium sp.]
MPARTRLVAPLPIINQNGTWEDTHHDHSQPHLLWRALALLLLIGVGGAYRLYDINKIRIGGPLETSNRQAAELDGRYPAAPAFVEGYLEATLAIAEPKRLEIICSASGHS